MKAESSQSEPPSSVIPRKGYGSSRTSWLGAFWSKPLNQPQRSAFSFNNMKKLNRVEIVTTYLAPDFKKYIGGISDLLREQKEYKRLGLRPPLYGMKGFGGGRYRRDPRNETLGQMVKRIIIW